MSSLPHGSFNLLKRDFPLTSMLQLYVCRWLASGEQHSRFSVYVWGPASRRGLLRSAPTLGASLYVSCGFSHSNLKLANDGAQQIILRVLFSRASHRRCKQLQRNLNGTTHIPCICNIIQFHSLGPVLKEII